MKKKTRNIILAALSGVLLVFCICAALLCWFLANVFDREPVSMETSIPDPGALESASTKLMEGLGNQSFTSVLGLTKPAESVLILSEDEVNAVISSSLSMYQTMDTGGESPGKPSALDIEFRDGVFDVKMSFDTGLWTPFGSYINGRIKAVPEIKNGHIHVRTVSCSAGGFEIDPARADDYFEKIIPKIEEDETGRALLKLVVSMKVRGKYLSIRYVPSNVSRLLLNSGRGIVSEMLRE